MTVPRDTDPRRNAFFPMHHGTTTFSLLAREAPGIPIAAYRFPAPDLCRFEALIDHMDGLSVRVVSLSMGSSNREEWRCFAAAAERHPQMLFVVSAGNDGRDIDLAPVYPAALPLDNIVTVTSSDDFGRLGRGSNSGATSVDFMVPAERIEVTDHRGARADTGGTSYAAPRLAALAARYLSGGCGQCRDHLLSEAPARPAGDAALKYGWIPDPVGRLRLLGAERVFQKGLASGTAAGLCSRIRSSTHSPERAVTNRPGDLRCHAQRLCIRRIDVEIAFQIGRSASLSRLR